MNQPKKIPSELYPNPNVAGERAMKDFLDSLGLTIDSPTHRFYCIPWGTFGKSGREPCRMIPLCELSNSHLQAILRTQHHILPLWRWIITDILYERAKLGDTEDECTWNG